MIQSYISMWKNFGNFSGRTRRRDFWLALVMNMIIVGVLYAILASGIATMVVTGQMSGLAKIATALLSIYGLAVFIPSLSLIVRRLHDTDKAGWWFLIAFVPFVGGIALLVFYCIEGTSGANRFGEDPKAV